MVKVHIIPDITIAVAEEGGLGRINEESIGTARRAAIVRSAIKVGGKRKQGKGE